MSKQDHLPIQGGKPAKGIYLLPNLFTTSGLFAGFYAIVAAMNGDFEHAAVAVFIAMVMDGLDGRVARLTNTQSAFGAEYDSLADIVSFGLAPSLVVYKWGLMSMGKPGWLIAFFFTAATALRLARFNTQPASDHSFFTGLPSPSAAGWIAGMVWVGVEYQVPGPELCLLAGLVAFSAALLMVSNVKYYSFKEIDLKGKVPFVAVLLFVIILVGISLDPPQVLLIAFSCYALSGPIWALKRKINKLKRKP